MRVTKLQLSGYRNIQGTCLELSPIVALIGPNNYGKSNFLDGIAFALGFIRANPSRKTEMMSDDRRVPINKLTAFDDFSFRVEYETNIDNEDVNVFYEYSFEWIKNKGRGSRIKSEQLGVRKQSASRYTRLINRTPTKAHYRSSRTGRADKPLEVPDNQLVINSLIVANELHYYQLVEEINALSFVNREFLDPARAFGNVLLERKGNDPLALEPGGDNIAKVLHHLREKYPDKFALIVNTLKSLIPSIETIDTVAVDAKAQFEHIKRHTIDGDDDIPFRLADTVHFVRIKERYNNQATDLSSISNGTVRILMLLTFTVLAGIQKVPLIGFEELEDCVHPSLFRRLLITLDALAGDTRIIITSHSPYIVQYLDLKSVYIGVPSVDGVARFCRVKSTKVKELNKMAQDEDASIGDLMFSFFSTIPDEEERSPLLAYLEAVR